MNAKQGRLPPGVPARFKFIRIVLFLMIVFFLLNTYFLFNLVQNGRDPSTVELAPFFVFQLNYSALVLIFVISIVWILHYGFGALARMERILEQIINGNYSFRVHLRKRDIMQPFAEKLNKVLDILEQSKR